MKKFLLILLSISSVAFAEGVTQFQCPQQITPGISSFNTNVYNIGSVNIISPTQIQCLYQTAAGSSADIKMVTFDVASATPENSTNWDNDFDVQICNAKNHGCVIDVTGSIR